MSGERERVDTAVGAVLFNASNFPERVKVHVLGQNMGPLREKITVAVLAALGLCACVEDVVCGTCMTSSTPPTDGVRALVERFDHLRKSGVCSPTTRSLLDDAQSLLTAPRTPPAGDVREALALTIAKTFPGWSEDISEPPRIGWSEALRLHAEGHNRRVNDECIRQGRAYADAVLDAFDVRPRGSVTDAEVQDVPGFSGTRAALDVLRIRGGENS